ncbi:hypothetical protein CDAR_222271 [Caerostris darwini]|uniref:Uncharacterized protein n=1 Tax=Caerostris darwini TaxID=1538125 RepID=A0AAV4W7I4_9ARAC|nr:hypothetical protein CDAR_222271 [Caerostris darwini]
MKKFPEKRAAAVRFTLGGFSELLFSHVEQEVFFHIVMGDCFLLRFFSPRRKTTSLLSEPSLTGVLLLKRRRSQNFFIYQSECFFESQKALVIYLRYSLSQFTERDFPKPEWEKPTKKYEEVSGKEV